MAAAHPAPAEPKTPLWFTCLGVALFLSVGLYMALGKAQGEEAQAEAPATVEAAAPTPTAVRPSQPPGAPQVNNAELQEALRKLQQFGKQQEQAAGAGR